MSQSTWADDVPQPATWPRSAADRYQPRSRLYKALDVASRTGSVEPAGWLRPVMGASSPSFEELKLFPNGRSSGPKRPEPAPNEAPQIGDPWTIERRTGNGENAESGSSAIRAGDRPEAEVAAAPTARPAAGAAPELDEPRTTAEAQVTAVSRTVTAESEAPLRLVVDLRPDRTGVPGPTALPPTDYGLGRRWGLQWRTAAQGWVEEESGRRVWRPVVATTEHLDSWEVDTYLGIVTAEVAISLRDPDVHQLGATLAQGREVGMTGLVEEAVERGAHGVLGVTMNYTVVEARMLITITGTAVTLRERAPRSLS